MKISILIDYDQYQNIWQILNSLREILGKKAVLLNGTKSIPYNLVATELLDDRYSFLYPPDDAYKAHGDCKNISLSRAEIVALSYALDDVMDLPENVKDLNDLILKYWVKKWMSIVEKSDFEKWLDKLNEHETGFTYTELRDEHPIIYQLYYERFTAEFENPSADITP